MSVKKPALAHASAHASVNRRDFVRAAGAIGLLAGAEALLPGYAWASPLGAMPIPRLAPRTTDGAAVYDLVIDRTPLRIAGRRASAVTINGTIPGPLIQLREGEDAVLRVDNRLSEDTSIHWHGLLVPPEMDGVPGVSFPGIHAGQTFEYRFPVKQYGTYWYHSHSGLQEQLGHYGPLIIEPAGGYPYRFDREYVVVLSDWTFENPYRVLDKLKKQGNYYNNNRRTLGDLFRDVSRNGLMSTVRERMMWLEMRMDPTDILDITGLTYTYLMNGLAPESNWTGAFQPGERVLLRFINASADTYFNVRIPELPMTVVQASGQYVQPVETDEFQIAIAETFDVIIEPRDRAYTLFAESMDRSGYARGTLTPRAGLSAPVPALRAPVVLAMADMGMDHGNMPAPPSAPDPHAGHVMPSAPDPHAGMVMPSAPATPTEGLRAPGTLPEMVEHGPGRHGAGNAAVPMMVTSRLTEPGTGLGTDGWRVLVYADLRALKPQTPFRAPTREIELHLTGNMERFMWSIDGIPFERAKPIRMNYGERIRLTMVNDTMMNHPMHLHGMWMELENGQGELIPRVHTVNVKPAERVSLLVEVDAPGRWAFHCHVLYHMEVGMFRVVEVSEPGKPFVLEASHDE